MNSKKYTKYWSIVNTAEWVWLIVICLFLALNGKEPLFSISMAVAMTFMFAVIGNVIGQGARNSKLGVVISELGTLVVTCVLSQLAKEFFIAFYDVVVVVSNSNKDAIQDGIDAGVIENGSDIIGQITQYIAQIGNALEEAFITAPFITGSSVVAFAILSYLVTRGVSAVIYYTKNN